MFDAKLDGQFNMWGDYLKGNVLEIDKPNTLKETWIVDGMEEPSIVTFTLKSIGNNTELTLLHENIPDNLVDELDSGWDDYYLGAIKQYLEQ